MELQGLLLSLCGLMGVNNWINMATFVSLCNTLCYLCNHKMAPTDRHLRVCVQQKKNVAIRAPPSSSPAIMAAVWTQDWSVMEPRSALMARMRATALNVRASHRKLCIIFIWTIDWTVKLAVHANKNHLVCWPVTDKFRILTQIPVDEQKGDLNFRSSKSFLHY